MLVAIHQCPSCDSLFIENDTLDLTSDDTVDCPGCGAGMNLITQDMASYLCSNDLTSILRNLMTLLSFYKVRFNDAEKNG